MNKLSKLIVSGALLCFTATSTYADNCNTTIQNNSNQPWIFRFAAFNGNVYFSGNVTCPVNGPCTIPPHTTVNIEYTHQDGYETGRVYIEDTTRWSEKLPYKNILPWVRCPTLSYYDRKDSISINDPQDGGFVINKDTWK